MSVIPETSRRVVTLSDWLPAITEHHAFVTLRADGWANLMKVSHALINGVDVKSRTTMPGLKWLKEYTKLSRATILKWMQVLKAEGFLAVVAHGRQGKYAPKNSDGHELYPTTKQGERTNERSVYVLCEPLGDEALALAAEAGQVLEDISRTPIPTSVGSYPPHTRGEVREAKAENDGPTARLEKLLGARSACGLTFPSKRQEPLWRGDWTTDAETKRGRRSNELQAALTMQYRSFALRQISAKHLAYVCRKAFEQGYTVNDILHALDKLPDGTSHRHDGLDGAKDVAKLIAYRLAFWMENGVYTYSPYQRQAIRSRDARARAIEVARAQKERAERPRETFNEVAARGAERVRAALRALRNA